ncbi:MAG: DUF6918 family protein [Elainellaceae cyanobacterium]
MELSDSLKDKTIKARIVADCVTLIDEQVAAKSGLSGMGMKAAYGAVKGVKPGYISVAIARLLPDTLAALDPMWSEGIQTGNPVNHLIQNRSRTADMILSVTDARIQKSGNGIVRSSYNKFRKSVKGDIENAVPGLAQIIGNHAKAPQETPSLEG